MTRPMRSELRCVIWAGIAVTLATAAASAVASAQTLEGVEQRVGELAQDVQLLQEINRLELTKSALTGLVAVLSEIRTYLDSRDALRRDILVRFEAQLEAYREALLKGQPVPMAITGQIDEMESELQDFAANTEQELLTRYALKVKAVLTQDQIDILTWADEAKMQATSYLDWARGMTEEEFNSEAALTAESLSEGQSITADEVAEVLTTARTLSDAEYAAAKDMLAAKLVPALRDSEVSTDMVLVQRMEPPRLLPLLKEKLAQMP